MTPGERKTLRYFSVSEIDASIDAIIARLKRTNKAAIRRAVLAERRSCCDAAMNAVPFRGSLKVWDYVWKDGQARDARRKKR
jgi:hypothetical protein